MNTIKNFVRPNATVSFSNIVIDTDKCRFTLDLMYVYKGKQKAHIKQVSGTITPEIREWLSVANPDKIKVVKDGIEQYLPTGTTSTGLQRFFARRNETFRPGILKETVFTSDNNSEDYYQNPFKIVMLNERTILTLVNIATKKRTETIDPNSGERTVRYSQRFYKNGDKQIRKSFTTKKNYWRLILQQDQIVEEAVPAQTMQD